MFLDKARIFVQAGNGGDGVARFRREKYVPAGGPAGGDGGDGGSVFFFVDDSLSTLIDFKYKRKYIAEHGQIGQSKNMYGKSGEDLIINVPPGTIVKHGETGEILADLTVPNQKVLAAKGGRGGRGNSHFATATRQAPGFAERGEPGQELWLELELKLIADVGLVGYPNAGKSTFLSVVSAAKPKIANYPFTTLVPNLGVVSLEPGHSFVIADIPGLIEGAHEGVGLGTEFLRHVERTKVLIHIVDVAGVDGRDPVEDYVKINGELSLYNQALMDCPQIVVANKMDLPEASVNFPRLEEVVKQDGYNILKMSAATSQGTREVLQAATVLLAEVRQAAPQIPEEQPGGEGGIYRPAAKRSPVDQFTIVQENEVYVVESEGIERMMRRLDLNNEEAVVYLQNLFEKIGLYKALAARNVPEGATVRVGELEFEYLE